MHILEKLALGLLACALSGCASTVEPAHAPLEPTQVSSAASTIIVLRTKSVAGGHRYGVAIGTGESWRGRGYYQGEQYIRATVPPGEHRVCTFRWQDRIDRCITIAVAAGETAFLEHAFDADRDGYITSLYRVDESDATVVIRNLKLGTELDADIRWTRGERTGTRLGH